jgi:hypothetical protein
VASERRYRIDDRYRSMLANDGRQFPDWIANSSRRFRMDHADHVGALAAQFVAQPLRVDRAAPLHVDASNRGAVALEDLGQAIAEIAGDNHHSAHAISNDVGHCGLHRGCACARCRQRQRLVVSAEQPPQ